MFRNKGRILRNKGWSATRFLIVAGMLTFSKNETFSFFMDTVETQVFASLQITRLNAATQ